MKDAFELTLNMFIDEYLEHATFVNFINYQQ